MLDRAFSDAGSVIYVDDITGVTLEDGIIAFTADKRSFVGTTSGNVELWVPPGFLGVVASADELPALVQADAAWAVTSAGDGYEYAAGAWKRTGTVTAAAIGEGGGGFADAPADGNEYVRKDSGWVVNTGGAGGVSDHGALTGLADDDHPQYLTEARGDARYSPTGHNHAGVYDPAGTAANAITVHEGQADPHTQYALADGTRGSFATTAQGALADTSVQNVQGVTGIWTGTQAAYDGLTPDASTLYVIVG